MSEVLNPKQEADRIVKEHFKSWFNLSYEEMEEIDLDTEKTPIGIIKAAIVTVKEKKGELLGLWFEVESDKNSDVISLRNLEWSMVLKELEERLKSKENEKA